MMKSTVILVAVFISAVEAYSCPSIVGTYACPSKIMAKGYEERQFQTLPNGNILAKVFGRDVEVSNDGLEKNLHENTRTTDAGVTINTKMVSRCSENSFSVNSIQNSVASSDTSAVKVSSFTFTKLSETEILMAYDSQAVLTAPSGTLNDILVHSTTICIKQ